MRDSASAPARVTTLSQRLKPGNYLPVCLGGALCARLVPGGRALVARVKYLIMLSFSVVF